MHRQPHTVLPILTATLTLLGTSPAQALEEGTITLSVKRHGGSEESFLYSREGDDMRLEKLGEHIPSPPVNLFDLSTGEVKILRPSNGTWTLFHLSLIHI